MKMKAFILTELLTGMMLQSLFALTLCGAFYMLLTFSSSTQKILAAHDEGQIVISYIDTRIRNAGLGLWACKTPENIGRAFTKISAIKNLPLPVAITRSKNDEHVDSNDEICYGHVLTLLYAHKDNKQSGLIVSNDTLMPVTINRTEGDRNKNHFYLLGGKTAYTGSEFGGSHTGDPKYIRNYAVTENSGTPVYLKSPLVRDVMIIAPSDKLNSVEIHHLSELLNLECERMYVDMSTGESSFMISTLGVNSTSSEWNSPTPHTKGILDIYMTLNTEPDIPIFDLKVLVSEGLRTDGETTECPADWPSDWTEEFAQHKVHVSQASWKLYNLAPISY